MLSEYEMLYMMTGLDKISKAHSVSFVKFNKTLESDIQNILKEIKDAQQPVNDESTDSLRVRGAKVDSSTNS